MSAKAPAPRFDLASAAGVSIFLPSLRLNAPVTPRPAYLWFLVWNDDRGHTLTCVFNRGMVMAKVRELFGGTTWRQLYRRGARVMRCKVSVSLEHSP